VGSAKGWTGESGVEAIQETTEIHGGTSSVKLTRTSTEGEDTEYKSDYFPVIAETAYTITAWFLDKDEFDAKARILIRWYDSEKTELSVNYKNYSADNSDWSEKIASVVSPVDAVFARAGIRIYADGGAVTGIYLYMDDFEITAD